jgi:antitoxin HicB
MRRFEYPVALKAEKGSAFTVTFPDLPEAITSGKDRADALNQAADCLEEAIAGRIADELDIPVPSTPKRRQSVVAVPAPMAAKAALCLAMRDSKITRTEFARRLMCDEKEVRRMLDPRHATKLATIARALQILGKRLIIAMGEEAA